jgi:tetratricopeptide (TPR) repeat protein
MVEPGRMFPVSSDWPFETWEVAVTPLPVWLPVEGRRARAWLAACYNSDTEKVLASEPGAAEDVPQLIEQVLTRAGRQWRSRPARVWVADAEVARLLEELLESQEVAVELVPRLSQLPPLLDSLIASMVSADPRPSALTGQGVTVERLRSFARAAARFYDSSCWRYLTAEDVIRIEAPEAGEALRYASVSRQGSQVAGLWLFGDPEDLDDLLDGDLEWLLEEGPGFWTLGFNRPGSAPPDDVDLWERHGLPWAGGDRCPAAYFAGPGGIERPDARQLAFFEGLLAALAATAEEDLDAGRWEKRVETVDGPVRFVLSLPGVLEPDEEDEPGFSWSSRERSMREISRLLEEQEFANVEEANQFLARVLEEGLPRREPETPREQAEDLLERASRARGRRAVVLARQALEVWPDCADAYSLLASRAPDPEAAVDLYLQALAAAERAMEPGIFEQAGSFWGLIETRPFMRALSGLAEAFIALGRLGEAAKQFKEMLRLNPNDNQGARESLVNVLIVLDRDEEAVELLGRYEEDRTALMAFPRALLQFRREGDSLEARRLLKLALKANRFVSGMLLRTRRVPPPSSLYSMGSEEEAGLYVLLSMDTWRKTPGALDWLRERTVTTTVKAVRSKSRSKPRGKKKKKRR